MIYSLWDEDSFLLKMVHRFNQLFGRLEVLVFRLLVLHQPFVSQAAFAGEPAVVRGED
jgi:hypothetical protein